MKLNLNAPFFQFINTAFDFVILNIEGILTVCGITEYKKSDKI